MHTLSEQRLGRVNEDYHTSRKGSAEAFAKLLSALSNPEAGWHLVGQNYRWTLSTPNGYWSRSYPSAVMGKSDDGAGEVTPPLGLLSQLAQAGSAQSDTPAEDELDAFDTSDSWDEQEAAEAAWKAAQQAEASASATPSGKSSLDEGTGVDEDAHLGLGDDDDESPEEIKLRQQAEKQAAIMLRQIQSNAAAVGGSPGLDTQRLMTSLGSVLRAIGRLSDKLDDISEKVDALQAASNSATLATPSFGVESVPALSKKDEFEWDGTIDESAWFDDDDDDDD